MRFPFFTLFKNEGFGVLSALTDKMSFRQTNPLQEGQNARRAESSAKGIIPPRKKIEIEIHKQNGVKHGHFN